MRAWILASILLAAFVIPAQAGTAVPSCVSEKAKYIDEIDTGTREGHGSRNFTGYDRLFVIFVDTDAWILHADHVGHTTGSEIMYGLGNACVLVDTLQVETNLTWLIKGTAFKLRVWGIPTAT